MAITYPISLPSTPQPASLVLRRRDIVGATQSIFTGQQQQHKHQGEWWEAEVVLPPLNRVEAAAWDAAIESLRGSFGTLLLGDASRTAPKGVDSIVGINLGFEAGDTGWPNGSASWQIVNDPSNARSGSWVGRIQLSGATGVGRRIGNQSFAVSPGDRVEGAAFIKGVGANDSAFCEIVWQNSVGGVFSVTLGNVISAGSGYQRSTASGIAPAEAVTAYVAVRSTGLTDGAWYVDDFTVTRISSKGLPQVDGSGQTGTQLVTKNWNGVAKGSNLGFEDGDTKWSGAWTISNDPANARSGSWVVSVAADGTEKEHLNSGVGGPFSVAPGDRVTASAWFKGVSADGSAQVSVRVRDSGNLTISEVSGSVITADGSYGQSSLDVTMPANAASAMIQVRGLADNTVGTWYADDCSITHYSAATGLLLPGDYIQLGSGTTQRLHRVLTQVDCDQTGAATLDIWPRLRESPADGSLLMLTNTQGVFRLAGPTEVERLPGGYTRLSFRCREAI